MRVSLRSTSTSRLSVVDDGSTDATGEILDRWQAGGDGRLVIHQANRGKGAAIRAAIPHVDGEIAVIQDADLEYDPVDVPALLDPLIPRSGPMVPPRPLAQGQLPALRLYLLRSRMII